MMGAGTITVQGNVSTPASVTLDAGFNKITTGTIYRVTGIKFQKSSSTATGAIFAENGAIFDVFNVNFGTGYTYHLRARVSGIIRVIGDYVVSGGANGIFRYDYLF
jgi:hypothetical protein